MDERNGVDALDQRRISGLGKLLSGSASARVLVSALVAETNFT